MLLEFDLIALVSMDFTLMGIVSGSYIGRYVDNT